MQSLDAQLIERIDRDIEQLFLGEDPALARNLAASQAAGLPEIQVSASEGKLLYLLARLVRARRVLEIGTLGGFSTTWLARAVGAGGRVVSLEVNPTHADVARRNIADGAPGVDVEILVGDAAELLRRLIDAGEAPFDVVFIDADKPGYPTYLELSLQLAQSGTLILADNVIRHGAVLDGETSDANARAARAFNAAIASHPHLESIVLPVIRSKVDGLSISLVK